MNSFNGDYLSILLITGSCGYCFLKIPGTKTLAPFYMCDKKIDNVKQLKKTNQKVFSEMQSTKLNIIFLKAFTVAAWSSWNRNSLIPFQLLIRSKFIEVGQSVHKFRNKSRGLVSALRSRGLVSALGSVYNVLHNKSQ